ncbi:MAG: ribosome silencing factor [Treponema sp.]|jgi:ribosome-associated protein|nr:ribosome silencing factor [Treponema sp.]
MKDTLQTEETAVELGKLLHDHNGGAVVVMDMRQLNFWTDFFVIATVTSNTHLSGLERHIKEYARENSLEILRRSRRPDAEDDEWALIDMGNIVIHLMTNRLRSFFELERLWGSAPLIYEDAAYSSKSS